MELELDKCLVALADCPVLPCDNGGHIVFNPYPVISVEDSPTLSHEICHKLAGRKDYALFHTAALAREDDVFQFILNLLLDWFHEFKFGHYSEYLWQGLTKLHADWLDANKYAEYKSHFPPAIEEIIDWYYLRNVSPESKGITDVVDLICLADKIYNKIDKFTCPICGMPFGKNGKGKFVCPTCGKKGVDKLKDKLGGGAGGDLGEPPKKSSYYIQAISKYDGIIKELSTIWKNNRYNWKPSYFGEINWKNLPQVYVGDQMKLPIFRLFTKNLLRRKVYIMVDRSGSTSVIKNMIMDSAIIIAESLRRRETPVSIIDIGHTNDFVNKITEPLDLNWFTPMADGGTPLGEVGLKIKDADVDSYLLIVTDGQPDKWDSLVEALRVFPGSCLTFVIGDSYGAYVEKIKSAISVQPHTIVRELYNASSLH
jgi:hypothetical protein